jgi:Domain of unknown function (DU1801)
MIALEEPEVAAVFETYPPAIRGKLLAPRKLIFATARRTDGVGRLQETLKWGQPSYLTADTKSGTSVRIDQLKGSDTRYAVYFHCQTSLVETFRALYPDALRFEGNRAIVLRTDEKLPREALAHCIALALTYHRIRRPARPRR